MNDLFDVPDELPTGSRYRRARLGDDDVRRAHNVWHRDPDRKPDAPERLTFQDQGFVSSAGHVAGMRFERCDWTGGQFGLGDGVELIDSVLVRIVSDFAIRGASVRGCVLDRAVLSVNDADLESCSFYRYARWDVPKIPVQSWSGAVLRNCVLEEGNLHGNSLKHTMMVDCRLGGVDLTDTPTNQRTMGAYFLRCDLTEANLEKRDLRGAIFDSCILTDVRGTPQVDRTCVVIAPIAQGRLPRWLRRCTVIQPGHQRPREALERAAWAGEQLPPRVTGEPRFPAWWSALPYDRLRRHAAWWAKGEASRDPDDPDRLRLEGADLRGAVLPTAALSGAVLRGCDLSGAVIGRCESLEATDCRFDEARISAMWGSTLTRCRFERARFVIAYFDHSRLDDCRFDGAVGRIILRDAELRGCSFDGASLVDVEFLRAELDACSFRRTKLRDGRAIQCSAPFATFRTCDLGNADIDNITLSSSTFLSCNFHGVSGTPWCKAGRVGDRRNGGYFEVTRCKLIDPIATSPEPEWFAECEVVRTAPAADTPRDGS